MPWQNVSGALHFLCGTCLAFGVGLDMTGVSNAASLGVHAFCSDCDATFAVCESRRHSCDGMLLDMIAAAAQRCFCLCKSRRHSCSGLLPWNIWLVSGSDGPLLVGAQCKERGWTEENYEQVRSDAWEGVYQASHCMGVF